eukprot:CAMPEP_0113938742 /NCGR_PEP_ID=MMETSP1339-20121228/5168_1 /TAXON_ID=94617 /ORGANISM="Fibrocapsa japonica" /LENGTH=435 /DNA_ID=CAMNT_0000942003 /DNA_START=8 /DNA_END=1312 /DNA_ORIENTATION=+ /assembly_acc=CAM_ASM_000762
MPNGEPDDYLWIVIVGGFLAVFTAYGIGANDVANAFSTSVGAKTLTLKQAVILGGIFEFLGAFLFGSHVTKTIRKGIADVECFVDDGEMLMYGMMCVIFVTGVWLLLATVLELPVSTTHSTIGGIIGMTMAAKGSSCVIWKTDTDQFPYVKGVAAVVISWILSPLFSAIVAAIFFLTTRATVLRHPDAYKRALLSYPIFVGCTLVIYIFFIIYKGAKGLELADTPLDVALGCSFGIGFGIGILMIPTFIPWLKKKIDAMDFEKKETEIAAIEAEGEEKDSKPDSKGAPMPTVNTSSSNEGLFRHDTHSSLKTDQKVMALHDKSEKFDEKAEQVFKSMQVFTACCDAFGHGANDVANSIGPYAAIYTIYKNNAVSKKNELGADAYWILFLGAIGIVIGLATYGYKIMAAMGVKMTPITPSRGFCIEMGATFVIILG